MHTKRYNIPKFWPLPKKGDTWAANVSAGPHPKEESIPLVILVRDFLKLAKTSREAKKLIREGIIVVNGRVRKDPRFLTGLFDVVAIPAIKKSYQILPTSKGLFPQETKEQDYFFGKITNKVAAGKKFQYTLHNSTTILTDKEYNTGDTLKIGFDGKVKNRFELKVNNYAMIARGKHQGMVGKISKIIPASLSNKGQVQLSHEKTKIGTILDYIFVCGKEKPEVKI